MTTGPKQTYQDAIQNKTLHPDPAQEEAVYHLQSLYEELAERTLRKPGLLERLGLVRPDNMARGLYIYGHVGRGKSMLMDMFFATAPLAKKRRVHFHDFMLETHDFIHQRRKARSNHGGMDAALPALAKKIAAETRLLCFDEFHVEDVADAMILGRLFTALFEQGVVVVATSNQAPGDLYRDGLQRELFLPFIELLKCRMDIFNLDGHTDYRSLKIRGIDAYRWPADRRNREKARALFDKLAEGSPAGPDRLTVKGREISVPKAAGDVASFHFADLCENPLGAADYKAIAEKYNTVFIDGLPQLRPEKRNEAKRLITLIDTLYEHKTRLVVTADVPPDRIYSGKDHGAAFHRTVSRLLEMQADDYMAG